MLFIIVCRKLILSLYIRFLLLSTVYTIRHPLGYDYVILRLYLAPNKLLLYDTKSVSSTFFSTFLMNHDLASRSSVSMHVSSSMT